MKNSDYQRKQDQSATSGTGIDCLRVVQAVWYLPAEHQHDSQTGDVQSADSGKVGGGPGGPRGGDHQGGVDNVSANYDRRVLATHTLGHGSGGPAGGRGPYIVDNV